MKKKKKKTLWRYQALCESSLCEVHSKLHSSLLCSIVWGAAKRYHVDQCV